MRTLGHSAPGAILVVEDDSGLAELIGAALHEQGCDTVHAATGADALAWLSDHSPTLVLLDFALPDMTGLQFLEKAGRQVPFMVTTGAGDERSAVELMKHGARDYLIKDARFLESLPGAVRRVLTQLDTERRLAKTELALRNSEERHRLLLQNANDAVFVHDLSDQLPGRILEVNDRACLMLGYTREELLAMSVSQLDVPEQLDRLPAIIQQLHDSGSAIFETEHVAKDGHRVRVEVSTRVFDLNGSPTVLSVVRDIAERMRAEAALRASEEKHRAILNASPDVIAITDLAGRTTMVSPVALAMFGYTREENVLGRVISDFVAPDDRMRAEANLAIMVHGTVPGPAQYRAIRNDGSTFDVEANSEFVRGADGRPASMVFVIRDITERKQVLVALRESEEKFARAFQTSPYAITITRTSDGRFIEVNDAFTAMSGFTREEALASSAVALKLWDSEQDRLSVLSELRAGGSVTDREYQFRSKSGVSITGLLSARTLQLSGKECILSSIHNITERKQASDQIAKQLDELRRWHAVTLGREGRIAELKREVNVLAVRLGLPPPYGSLTQAQQQVNG